MVNINGFIFKDSNKLLSLENRGFTYGDSLFETIKVINEPLFWEYHYFRLISSMRILRMDIPMNFTPEYLEKEIMELLKKFDSNCKSFRVKLIVFRKNGGYYLPNSNHIEYAITAKPLKSNRYILNNEKYEIELFKDFLVSPNLLSTLKTNNKVTNVIGSIYANENNFDNCLLINTNKNIIEALNGNIFIVKDNIIKTPPLSDGCLNGIIRKKIIEILKGSNEFELEVNSILSFELQKSDEIFITNVIDGINSVTKYRKKNYSNVVCKKLINKLNNEIGFD